VIGWVLLHLTKLFNCTDNVTWSGSSVNRIGCDYPSICLEGLSKATRNLCRGDRYSGLDSSTGLSEYKAASLSSRHTKRMWLTLVTLLHVFTVTYENVALSSTHEMMPLWCYNTLMFLLRVVGEGNTQSRGTTVIQIYAKSSSTLGLFYTLLASNMDSNPYFFRLVG
jgi:hypothetical protein